MKMIGDQEPKNEKQLGLWRDGRAQYKAFTKYHVKKSTFIITTLQGILLTFVCILPFILILTQFYISFAYIAAVRNFIIVLAFALLLIANGLSNYFTVKCTKTHAIDDEKLQAFEESKIFFYTTFQIGFIIFAFVLMVIAIILSYSI